MPSELGLEFPRIPVMSYHMGFPEQKLPSTRCAVRVITGFQAERKSHLFYTCCIFPRVRPCWVLELP